MMKQTDEMHVGWTNTAEDEWFHNAMPWFTNFDSACGNSNGFTSYQAQHIVNGYVNLPNYVS